MNARIVSFLAIVLGAVSLFHPAVAASDHYDLKISTFEPVGNHYTNWLQTWAETLNQRSGGRL
jgi:TRAP-type C4-dicarboxylate transport system substrate-binding protein